MSSTNNDNFWRQFYRKHMILCNVILMIFVSIFLAVFSMFFIDIWTNHGNTTVVPDVRKMGFSEAVETLQNNDLEVEIADSIYDTSLKPGQVKEVWPRPGARVKPGRTVFLTINSFQPQQVTVSMPLTGVSSRQAQTYLESIKIKNIKIEYVPSNFPDLVEAAKYKGKNIVPGMQIPVTANVVLYVGNLKQGERQKPTQAPSVKNEDPEDDKISEPEANQTETEIKNELQNQSPQAQPQEDPQPKSDPAVSNPDVFD